MIDRLNSCIRAIYQKYLVDIHMHTSQVRSIRDCKRQGLRTTNDRDFTRILKFSSDVRNAIRCIP
jgi:hypothetical protein